MTTIYYAIAIGLFIMAFLTLCIAVNRYRAGYYEIGEIGFILTGVTVGVAVMLMVIAS